VFEDGHLLVVNKPPGWNTHSPSPHAGEGIYEWLRHREPRWADLAIVHRLDKETSGLLVFGKTSLANRSLTQQFERREIGKTYLLLTRHRPRQPRLTVRSRIVRDGDRYRSLPATQTAEDAITEFEVIADAPETECGGDTLLRASPLTGRTHQIRVHAAESGFPISGDALYGGAANASGRVCLHAARLTLRHPATGEPLEWRADARFIGVSAAEQRRSAIIVPAETNAFRADHGEASGASTFVDVLGDFTLIQSATADRWPPRPEDPSARGGTYFKRLDRHIGRAAESAGPEFLGGRRAPERFPVRENGVIYELSFGEGYSVGLFLDQRDNRRRLLTNHVAAGFPLFADGPAGREVLNCFAYTCAFSVCAALAGARTTSLDLSKKYLDWGRRNFGLNGIDPAAHDFIFGDTFDWLRRLAKKGRTFDLVLLDPPTFSRSKEHGEFRAESDYGELVAAALPVLKPGGVLFASSNAARLEPERFLAQVRDALRAAGRRATVEHYVPQPPDFPISRDQPAYLKTVWLRVG
jgi:23S rRNA (cytosine1962-C5)-methyltransferase